MRQQPLTHVLEKQIFEGFSRHAIEMTGYDELQLDYVAFVAMHNDAFAGAVVVQFFWGALNVKYVYVEDAFRGHGLATRLMERALTFGRENKCPFAFVATMSFQALGFYQKMGFQLEFTRSGYSHDTLLHYLRKNLSI